MYSTSTLILLVPQHPLVTYRSEINQALFTLRSLPLPGADDRYLDGIILSLNLHLRAFRPSFQPSLLDFLELKYGSSGNGRQADSTARIGEEEGRLYIKVHL